MIPADVKKAVEEEFEMALQDRVMEESNDRNKLVRCINSYRKAAFSNVPRFDHIDISEKEKVLNECVEAEAWLREKKLQQDSLPKYVTPVFSSADVLKKTETLDRFCKPIMTKPRPAPAKPATLEAPPTPPPRPVSSSNLKELMLMPALPRGQQMAVLRHRLLQNQRIWRLLQLLRIVLSSGSCLLMFCFSRKNLVLMYKVLL
nr:heat shock 70 kda protein 15 [Quercus suber]